MSEHRPAPERPDPERRSWRGAYREAWRHPDGTPRRTPAWALAVLLITSGLLVPLLLLGNSEDKEFSESTTGIQSSGGETVRSSQKGSDTYVCRDAPVEFEVAGRQYAGSDVASGRCLASGDTRSVTVRYDPDDPQLFTLNERQWLLYVFAGLAALGFLATLVAVVRRLRARARE